MTLGLLDTDIPVQTSHPGVTITQAEADNLLKQDLKRFEDAVNKLIEVPFNQNEFDATVSFTYNCGAGALESSTFRRRINAGEDKATCFQQEFPKWGERTKRPHAWVSSQT